MLAALFAPAAALAQEIASTVRISTSPEGAWFGVDGVFYNHPVTVIWPAGSKHTITAVTPPPAGFNVQYSFSQWEANGTVLPKIGDTVVVTADPSIKEIRGTFTRSYGLTIGFFDCGDAAPNNCKGPGTIFVNGEKVVSDRVIFFAEGSTVILIAVPNDNYVFTGWAPDQNQIITGFINTVKMDGPTAVHPQFTYARRINLVTDPPELLVLADRTPTPTPAALDWGTHTTHTLGPVSPQQDKQGVWWAFQSWSTGAAPVHAYQLDQSTTPVTITAKYVPVAVTQVSSLPPGLALKVDGRNNWPSYNFPWGVGETHKIEAPAELTDAQGRVWKFRSWSDGGEAAHEFKVPETAAGSGVRLVATYDPLARLLVKSSLAGLRVTVDGADCVTPCDIQRDMNTKVRVTAPASVRMGEDVRADFTSWRGSPANGLEWSATLGTETVTITADYRMMNRLLTTSDPPSGVTWKLSPDSPDGYYDAKAVVTVGVAAQPGYRFRGWTGDLTGTSPTGVVPMHAPRSVQALLDRIPYISPTGVTNAAGVTPKQIVAPGSVASVFGLNLAAALAVGPEKPLSQTLGGLTVRMGDRFLPLFFVSPSQINLQLPSDLGEGPQVLTVTTAGSPDVRAAFTVARSAPGIFTQTVKDESHAVALHEDGSPVTVDSPARKGELLSVFGTGFGPTVRPRPDGFPVPAGPSLSIADAVWLRIADNAVQASSAFAAAGRVGVDVVQFRLGDDVPSGSVSLLVVINEQQSNTVLLPVE